MSTYPFEVQDVLNTSRDPKTGAVLLQIGDVVYGNKVDDDVPLWQSPGFVSVPANPTGKSSCQVVVLKTGDTDIAIAGRDVRTAAIAGSLKPGEAAAFASVGQARTLYKADGSVTHYTTEGNVDGGTSVFLRIAPDGLTVHTPWGFLTITADGVQIGDESGCFIRMKSGKVTMSGNEVVIPGGTVSLGPLATPASTAVWGPSGIAGVASATVRISP